MNEGTMFVMEFKINNIMRLNLQRSRVKPSRDETVGYSLTYWFNDSWTHFPFQKTKTLF
jgi:hypothetical protein